MSYVGGSAFTPNFKIPPLLGHEAAIADVPVKANAARVKTPTMLFFKLSNISSLVLMFNNIRKPHLIKFIINILI
jgi:hypothetical protein